MKRKEFTGEERYAFWQQHKKKCAWCRKYMRETEVILDHIIPLSLKNDPEQLKRVLSKFELAADFDLDGYGNLVPCHAECNRLKWDRLLPDLILVEALRQAAVHADAIRSRVNKMRSDDVFSEIEHVAKHGLKKLPLSTMQETCLRAMVLLTKIARERITRECRRLAGHLIQSFGLDFS
jgi:hypothetical protein